MYHTGLEQYSDGVFLQQLPLNPIHLVAYIVFCSIRFLKQDLAKLFKLAILENAFFNLKIQLDRAHLCNNFYVKFDEEVTAFFYPLVFYIRNQEKNHLAPINLQTFNDLKLTFIFTKFKDLIFYICYSQLTLYQVLDFRRSVSKASF